MPLFCKLSGSYALLAINYILLKIIFELLKTT